MEFDSAIRAWHLPRRRSLEICLCTLALSILQMAARAVEPRSSGELTHDPQHENSNRRDV